MEPLNFVSKNRIENGTLSSPELSLAETGGNQNTLDKSIENNELQSIAVRPEAGASLAKSIAVSNTTALPTILPNVVDSATVAIGKSKVISGSPLVAADEDTIEKEWINRAKKIVDATRDDPAERDDEVSNLRSDYKQKRYGVDNMTTDKSMGNV